jgi:hypothetical protein
MLICWRPVSAMMAFSSSVEYRSPEGIPVGSRMYWGTLRSLFRRYRNGAKSFGPLAAAKSDRAGRADGVDWLE